MKVQGKKSPTRVRLTRRGRVVVVMMSVLMLVAFVWLVPGVPLWY